MDPAAMRIAGAGVAVAVIAVIGAVLGTWRFDWSAIVLILAGLLAAGTAVLTSGAGSSRAMPIAKRDLILTGGVIAAVLGVLFLLEVLFDFDDLDNYGGILGAVAALALAAAGVVLYVLAASAWSGSPIAPWTRALAATERQGWSWAVPSSPSWGGLATSRSACGTSTPGSSRSPRSCSRPSWYGRPRTRTNRSGFRSLPPMSRWR
jgi:hypothetical protein